jgi:hypothetical protein
MSETAHSTCETVQRKINKKWEIALKKIIINMTLNKRVVCTSGSQNL